MWNFHLLKEAFGLDEQQAGSWKSPLGGDGAGAWILPMIFGYVSDDTKSPRHRLIERLPSGQSLSHHLGLSINPVSPILNFS